MIRAVIADLRRPDSQPHDWYGWATNQLGHGVVGMAGVLLAQIVLPPVPALGLVVVLYHFGWERGVQAQGDRADALSDTAHVAQGAALITAALTGSHPLTLLVALVWAATLFAGIRRRLS